MLRRIVVAAALAALVLGTTAGAVVPIQVHGHLHRLQKLVDSRYGRGSIDVTRDYIGARAGDPDPWMWASGGFAARLVRTNPGHAGPDTIGWYEESGVRPAGPCGGVVFADGCRPGATASVEFGRLVRYGFFVRRGDGDDDDGASSGLLFTNRWFNPPDLLGPGASSPRGGGYPAALVFDVSRWTQPRTWLVCFTDRGSRGGADDDRGGIENGEGDRDDGHDGLDDGDDGDDGHGDGPDYSAAIFEVTSFELTPVRTTSFGSLKSRYRH
jgi:hypothetical protein